MKHSKRFLQVILVVVLALGLFVGLTACAGTDDVAEPAAPSTTPAEEPAEAPVDDPAKQVVDTKCSLCHSLDRVYDATKTRDEWVTTVDRMKTNGMVITEDEYDTIIGYLSGE